MIRESPIAGSWYPGEGKALARQIDGFLQKAKCEDKETPFILISPHAGYFYSGQVAAFAYKQVEGKSFDKVVIIAPSHYHPIRGAALFGSGAFRTPLGLVDIDEDICRKLIEGDNIFKDEPRAHSEEHSLEIQIPFLQRAIGNFKMVPILSIERDMKNCTRIASAIKEIADEKTLIVASSDLSHFYNQKQALKLDSKVIEAVKELDTEGFYQNVNSGECEACGSTPILIALLIAGMFPNPKSKIYCHATSGDISGDFDRVVGYLAAGLYRGKN
ncbi:MAG: AmmeMemoRadiSam system protein B [Candidatus Schekmanbacteria bacterium]|nr:AmmeMemoRadiSam system protein B [Candidatus Schekmanbacteria bacterium]